MPFNQNFKSFRVTLLTKRHKFPILIGGRLFYIHRIRHPQQYFCSPLNRFRVANLPQYCFIFIVFKQLSPPALFHNSAFKKIGNFFAVDFV
jgi:hypothetical protein